MIRMKISKFKQACMLAFIPRVFRGEICSPGKFKRLSLGDQQRAYRCSTSSCSRAENDCERCQQIIDRVFAPNPPFTGTIFTECDPQAKGLVQMVSIGPPDKETRCEVCRRLIKHIFGEESDIVEKHTENVEKPQVDTLKATTAKIHEEQLAQKVEVIDETPLVEAHKPKIEGFNLQPKVLGGKKDESGIEILHFSTSKNVNDGTVGSVKKEATNFDELAKRCLNSPSGQFDECLLKEMEKLGVPPTSGRDFKKNLNEKEFVQAEIMKKPKKPSKKVDLDFISVDNKHSNNVQKDPLSSRATYAKSVRNSMIACRAKPSFMSMKKQYMIQTHDNKLTNPSYRHVTSNDLGYIATTGVFGDTPIKPNSGDPKQQNDKPDIRGINFVDHISVTIEQSIPKATDCNAADCNAADCNAADAKHYSEKLKTSQNQDIIQNLIRTRFEHLMPDSIKSTNFMEDNSNIFAKTNILIGDQNETMNHSVQNSDKSASKIEDPMTISKKAFETNSDDMTKECSQKEKVHADSKYNIESTDTDDLEGKYDTSEESARLHDIFNKYFQSERTPTHVLYKTDIKADEKTTLPHPGVIIREHIEFSVDPNSTQDSRNSSMPKTTKSGDGFLYEVHSQEDKVRKRAYDRSQTHLNQYQMKGEPTVYKSDIYRKYLEYIQNAQKPITKSDVYSRHHSIISTDEPKPIKSVCSEGSDQGIQYISCVIKDKKQPAVDESPINQTNETQSTEKSFMNDHAQHAHNAQQSQTQEQFTVSQSGNYNPQSSQQQHMHGQPMYNYQDPQQRQMQEQPIYNPQSKQQMPMQSQPMYNPQSGSQMPLPGQPTNNYGYNQYTNYMHSVQAPQTGDQYFMNQKNIYNPYNYVPNTSNNQPDQGETSKDNNSADYMVSVKQEIVEKSATTENEKSLNKDPVRVIVAETCRFPTSIPDMTNTSVTEEEGKTNEIKEDSHVLSRTLDKPLISEDSIEKSNTAESKKVIDMKAERVIVSETVQNLASEPNNEKPSAVVKEKPRDDGRLLSEKIDTSQTVRVISKTSQNHKPEDQKPSTTVEGYEKDKPKDDGRLLSQKIDSSLISVATEIIQEQPPSVVVTTSCPTETLTLSQLLKKVRERNRLEYCRDMKVRMHCATEVNPAKGKCGPKQPPCPPPAPTCPPIKPKCPPPVPSCPPCPPPPKPKCPPPKPPCPNPCKPKCPPPCTPNPCGPKPPCPPPKKSPCDKFKCNCSPAQVEGAMPLLIHYETQFHIPKHEILPQTDNVENENMNEVISTLQKVCRSFLASIHGNVENTVMIYNVKYARTYHPWSPIPSWPIPKKQDKKKLVCPKDGCKEAPPRLNPPCSDINPCINLPKPNSLSKRSFSILDFLYQAMTKANS